MAKVAVIGATGGIGSHVVTLALKAGHEVKALARTPSKLPSSPGLEAVQGSVTDTASVRRVVAGCDIVLSALGTRAGENPVVTTGTKNVVEAMRAEGVERMAMISSVGVGDAKQQGYRTSQIFMRMIVPLFLKQRFYELADAEAAARAMPKAVVVRPTALSNGSWTGKYTALTASDKPISGRISRADVAQYLVDLLGQTRWDGQSVSLYPAR